MKSLILFFILFSNLLLSDSLDNLLKEYENTSENSLQTVDEKLGHVFIYSQKDIRLMQYQTLNDILKELPLINLNKNRYGFASPSLAGSKTTVSGFFRFFINDYEVSSVHTQSASLTWGDVPLDFIDHVEVYYGDSSFALGNETGIYFIRMYTKSAKKENATEFQSIISSNSNSQSITQSKSFKNDWSYLLFLNNTNKNDSTNYKNDVLENNTDKKFLYLDLRNDTTDISLGYTSIKKDNYMGLAIDVEPNQGEIKSDDIFINVNKYFSYDNSIKTAFSININTRKYNEVNNQGLGLTPIIDFTKNPALTIPKEFIENLKFTKTNALISKTYNYKKNTVLAAFNIKNKKYEVKNRQTTNFADETSNQGQFNNFDEETVYSLLFQDDYKVNDKLFLVANVKFDKYKRSGYLENSKEKLFRAGVIYTPFDNFGLKSFYTQTYLPPTFYNADFASSSNKNINSQKYEFYTVEGVYTTQNSKLSITYDHVKIKDFIYFTPIGFINVDHEIKTEGVIFNYDYLFENKNKLQLTYYFTTLSEELNNSNNGALFKYMGSYNKFDYFTSLIYKNAYTYKNVHVKNSYNLNLGTTYNYSKDLSFSLKGENLLDKSTQSLYTDGFPGTSFSLKDEDRKISFSMKWVF